MSESLNRNLLRLTTLLQLEQRARRAAPDELAFVMVNETAGLLPYRQAVLWRCARRGDGRVLAVSGVADPDGDGPYLAWLRRLLRRVAGGPRAQAIHAFGRQDVADDPDLDAGWREWLPDAALWVPLADPAGRLGGGLLFVRGEPWGEAEQHLFGYLGEAYGHAWAARTGRGGFGAGWRPRLGGARTAAAAAVLLLAAAFIPVRQSVLAPAEVVPTAPTLVRASIDGVVDRVHVDPNQPVETGQPLLSLDATRLQARLKVALKARDIARAQYLQAIQQAVADPRAKARLAVLEAEVEQQGAEVEYVQSLLARVEIAAPHAGIAIFDDVNEWAGRPVSTGERILLLADPAKVELEIRVPLSDALALALEPGAEIAFFRNVAPDRPVDARLASASYRSAPTPDGVRAYRVTAAFADGAEPLRIGLEGVAKIYGPETTAAMWVLRRPLAVARQWLGQ
ncbi:efflux RND transporter periplasmic adaptor subunit [Arenibaculum sp.]|uniref:efflux RND transporter periplasmic adaptor subunit n=1 Tax=Arenibaculum sp. TaxID=2865862 RepID=UPI002E118288|nr:HlyD family efflux transporter periplasmic adaptor subunit [Arenibaculum sp.]